MPNIMTFEQVASVRDLMKEHDAQDVDIDFDPGSSNIVHVNLSRDDEEAFCCSATISVAGHVRRWATVPA